MRSRHEKVIGIGEGREGATEVRVEPDHPDLGPQEARHQTHGFGRTVQTVRRTPSPPARFVSAESDTQYDSAERPSSGTVNTRRDAPELKMEESSTLTAARFAATGTKRLGAKTNPPATYTNAPAVERRRMALRNAISQRKLKPLTPLVANEWEDNLRTASLHTKYPQIPEYIRHGAYAGIPHIHHSYTPLNKDSTETLEEAFNDIIQTEFNKGRYLGPFSREELEHEIGPFQSSPLSLVPKAGKPGKYRLIQNLSHPHTNHPTPSINSRLNSDDFPCTWGTFRTVCALIRRLPQGSQAATRDISEAYRLIPLHESQWAGVVVRITNSPDKFALNTSNSFGGATSGGLFGLFGDALADILRAKGIGPILKWVDDFIFFRIPRDTILEYNIERRIDRRIVADNGGRLRTGGRFWYKGKVLADVGAEHFAEDFTFPISTHENQDPSFPYGFEEIDKITAPLGIPWETSKDVPFNSVITFTGLSWDLERKTVALPNSKKEKYNQAISEWMQRHTHSFEDTRKLYGKLLYATHVIPRGRAYLTNLEKMMGAFHERPFTPRHPPKHLIEDLAWWRKTLAQPSISRKIPGGRQITNVEGYSDASSTIGIGIILGGRWRAWRLIPGWNKDGRDIGWAEAVGMELLVRAILQHNTLPGIKIFGDNNGVIEGWWTGRSRNTETNRVFRRIHELLEEHDTILTTRYINTANNPADGPSRGIYPPRHLLLPPIKLPDEIKSFVINFDAPLRPNEPDSSQRVPPEPKSIIPPAERHRRHQANANADEQSENANQATTLD